MVKQQQCSVQQRLVHGSAGRVNLQADGGAGSGGGWEAPAQRQVC